MAKKKKGRPRVAKLSDFGARLRTAISESPRVDSRADFARKAEIDPSQLYRYELGRTFPRIDQLEYWAGILGCGIHDLVPGRREPEVVEYDQHLPPAVEQWLEERGDRYPEEIRERIRRTSWYRPDELTLEELDLHASAMRAMREGKMEKLKP